MPFTMALSMGSDMRVPYHARALQQRKQRSRFLHCKDPHGGAHHHATMAMAATPTDPAAGGDFGCVANL
jgi:hypothetical protein